MAVNGAWTPCDLSNTAALAALFDARRHAAPPLSQNAVQLSLELAASAYDMQTVSWQAAGWTDFSYQVDNALFTGSKVNAAEGSVYRRKLSGFLTHLARKRIQKNGPISQLYGTLRQKEKSDTCKSLVMCHALPNGQYLIAIGFMGTGRRLFDWISNLRLQKTDGVHRGFMQLTEEFISHCDDIRFPCMASALEQNRLTLADVLEACTRPHSPFRIWMSGHSQGGAVMQVFTRHLLDMGVLPQYLAGFGFASPTVDHTGDLDALLRYPLHHFICSDDLTPRIGARHHMGMCHVLPMTDALRAECYPDDWQKDGFSFLLRTLGQFTDTRSSLLFLIGFLRALSHISDHDANAILSGLAGKFLPDRLLDLLGDGVSRLMQRFIRQLTRSYLQITGEPALPAQCTARHELLVLQLIYRFGAQEFAALLTRTLSQPHQLRDRNGGASAYQRMATDLFTVLRPMDAFPNGWPLLALPSHAPRRVPCSPRFGRLSARKIQRTTR